MDNKTNDVVRTLNNAWALCIIAHPKEKEIIVGTVLHRTQEVIEAIPPSLPIYESALRMWVWFAGPEAIAVAASRKNTLPIRTVAIINEAVTEFFGAKV